MKRHSVCLAIPARLESTRFPRKILADLEGRPMIWWVWRAARDTPGVDAVYVATDSEEVRSVVEGFGGQARMTASTHQSGTDRIAEAVRELDHDVVINVQGDQPLIDSAVLSALVEGFVGSDFPMGTLVTPLEDPGDVSNPERVKVVVDARGRALYFSRAPVPYHRGESPRYLKHIGVYAYRREFLLEFTRLPPSHLERAESLEQLRALENGYGIGVIEVDHQGFGVETESDLEVAARQLRERGLHQVAGATA